MTGAKGWRLESDKSLSGYALEWSEPGHFILSKANSLFHSTSLKPPFMRLGQFPAAWWRKGASHFRAAQRLLRFMFYNVVRLPNGDLFTTFDKHVGLFADGEFRSLPGLARPCRVLRAACAQNQKGEVFFGEYFSNQGRGPMHIYRLAPEGEKLELAYTFPAGSIRHIHGIYFDIFSGCLWCVTGDREGECRILRTSDGFNNIETVGEGDESWRCVSLLFTKESVYYASDAEFNQNHIYSLDRRTGERKIVAEIDGPVYYSQKVGDDLFFAVTAELCPSQTEPSASVWNVAKDGTCSRVASFRKDFLPVSYFMPGTLHFPLGPGASDGLVFQAVGLKGMDGETFRLFRSNQKD